MSRRVCRSWPCRAASAFPPRCTIRSATRLDVAFEDLGEQNVKNIVRPLRVFRVLLKGESDSGASGAADETGVAIKPSLVVLPFVNMSGDPEQEFFADGLTEDIITELSRFRELLVISRNSAFVHKGKTAKVQDIAREFDVHYVVEGSVRKAGDRVRVTVQLIDAETDRHVWAERYDRKIEDIFAIQDEVTRAIVGTLPGRIEAAGHDRAKRKPTQNMAAYEYVLTGKVLHHRSTPDDNAEAQRMLDRAIALDQKYAHAHAWKACVLAQTWVNDWCKDRRATWQRGHRRGPDRADARRPRQRRAPDSRRGESGARRSREGAVSPGARAQPQSQQRPHPGAATASCSRGWAGPRTASSGSGGPCG